MKSTIHKTGACLRSILFFLALFALSVSCSTSDNDGNGNPSQDENTWKLGSTTFLRDDSLQILTNYVSGEPFTIVNVDSNFNNNLVYKICNFIATFNTSTTGAYSVKSEDALFSDLNAKTLLVECIIGDGLGNTAKYESVDSNLAATVTQQNGEFLVTITEPITLTRVYNNGLSEAPETFTLKCNKVR